MQEQCCLAVLEDNMCNTGINMAKTQGSCDYLFANTCETKTTKVCPHENNKNNKKRWTEIAHNTHQKCPYNKSFCITSPCELPVRRQKINERCGVLVCLCVCTCVCVHTVSKDDASLQGGLETVSVRYYKFTSDYKIPLPPQSKNLLKFLFFFGLSTKPWVYCFPSY